MWAKDKEIHVNFKWPTTIFKFKKYGKFLKVLGLTKNTKTSPKETYHSRVDELFKASTSVAAAEES